MAPVPRLLKQPVVWTIPHQYVFPKPKAADAGKRDAVLTHVRWMSDHVAEWTLKAGQVSALRKAHSIPPGSRPTRSFGRCSPKPPTGKFGQATPKWVAAENVTRPVIETVYIGQRPARAAMEDLAKQINALPAHGPAANAADGISGARRDGPPVRRRRLAAGVSIFPARRSRRSSPFPSPAPSRPGHAIGGARTSPRPTKVTRRGSWEARSAPPPRCPPVARRAGAQRSHHHLLERPHRADGKVMDGSSSSSQQRASRSSSSGSSSGRPTPREAPGVGAGRRGIRSRAHPHGRGAALRGRRDPGAMATPRSAPRSSGARTHPVHLAGRDLPGQALRDPARRAAAPVLHEPEGHEGRRARGAGRKPKFPRRGETS